MTTTPGTKPQVIKAVALSQEAYSAYGDVIAARDDVIPGTANMGTAKRFNFLAKIENLRPGKAEANFCFFRCSPMVRSPQTTFDVHLLERHPFSTQAFIPMQGAEAFLVIVCLGKEQPDLSTIRAFIAQKSEGMTYRPGVWHHPLVAMNQETDFACLVWEDGSTDDCDVRHLAHSVSVAFA